MNTSNYVSPTNINNKAHRRSLIYVKNAMKKVDKSVLFKEKYGILKMTPGMNVEPQKER